MSDELTLFDSIHRPSFSSASSTVPSAASPLSPSVAESSTPPEYLFHDYASPTAAGLPPYVSFNDDEHSLYSHHPASPLDHARPRVAPLLLPHHHRPQPHQSSPLSRDPPSATSHHAPPPLAPPAPGVVVDGVPAKRGRGRPRKHPLIVPSTVAKGQKGARSKTGCGTCRRRKKKCDEAKPTCLNCQKNGVQCEGYRPVETWKSGKGSKASRSASESLPATPTHGAAPTLLSILAGVETDLDRHILEHFNTTACQTFAPWSDPPSAFRDLFLPLAVRDKGVMHSLLALSGSHLHNQQASPELEQRTGFHHQEAIRAMTGDNAAGHHVCDPLQEANHILAARAILLCLKSGVTGEVSPHMEGYRIHWNAIAHMALECPCRPVDAQFQSFINEFASFYGICQAVTSLRHESMMALPSNFQLPTFVPSEAGSFLGAFDSIFLLLSKVTSLRHKVRARRLCELTPQVDAQDLAEASRLEIELEEWVCNQTKDTLRWTTGHLYRVCAWIFLKRTILPSRPSQGLRNGVEEGLSHLSRLLPEPSTHGVLLMPLFLLGCAAFDDSLRPPISRAFEILRQSRGSENINRAYDVVVYIWQLMDEDSPASWDWEMVMTSMGWDFLVT